MLSREAQIEIEMQADTEAAAQRLQEMRLAAESGDISLPRAARFIANAYGVVKDQLEAVAAVKTRGRGGVLKNWLRRIDSSVAAVIAVRECISMCQSAYSTATIQHLGIGIGRLWETEIRISEADKVNPMYMQKVHEQIKERGTHNKDHIKGVYNKAYTQIMKGELDSSLTNAELIQLGKFGVQACTDAGIIELHKGVGSNGSLYLYDLTPEIQHYLTDYTDKDVQGITDKLSGMMFCPPDAWSSLHDGGYLSNRRKVSNPLVSISRVRRSERPRLRQEYTAERMPVVFDTANYLQSQAFTLHEPTLRAVRRVWEEGGGVLGVPSKSGPRKPVCPMPADWIPASGTETEVAVFHRWKREMVRSYDEIREWRGHVRELSGFLKATRNGLGKPLWFPVFLDTRGRWYYRGTPNPQGSDVSKAILHAHEKKPLGQRGLFWLKVAIANSFGFDKERFVERAAWTEQNWKRIESALDEPENHLDVWGKDSPWCMYTAAWELREAYRSGCPEQYCTGVPVHMDATCSGLQHFSAMLRDPIGGLYVNLYDQDFVGPKQDIYGKVAHYTMLQIDRDAHSEDETVRAQAKFWQAVGIPRGMAKGPVMTYVYGATMTGAAQGIRSFVETDMPEVQWPEDMDIARLSCYLASRLFSGIAKTVPAAASAMRWLRGVAKDQPAGKRMEWTSPMGFKVQHDYEGFDMVNVKIRSCGVTHAVVREYNGTTRPIQMQNAVSPNFVHALDASHLALTALRMRDSGCFMVGIHDSFGTHPCDVDTMHEHVRAAFVGMYSEDVLGSFLWEVGGIGEVPMRGTLDLAQVADSEFFFC